METANRMAHLDIILDGDGAVPELAKNPTVRTETIKVTCLAEGSVLAEGSIDFVSSDAKVIENYLGR